MERSIQGTSGCMERDVHRRVRRGAAAMRMQKGCPVQLLIAWAVGQ